MHQLSIGVLLASLLGVTVAVAAPTTHLPLAPSVFQPHATQASSKIANSAQINKKKTTHRTEK
ncbi:hypothetical protein [Serratia marcescens]|uniref:hypothetical protein n=1 Tax=Serratia marcescens TaxID=615 RepID=UPI0021BDE7E4|nr:hypothetical protein [Serratia marcescens]